MPIRLNTNFPKKKLPALAADSSRSTSYMNSDVKFHNEPLNIDQI